MLRLVRFLGFTFSAKFYPPGSTEYDKLALWSLAASLMALNLHCVELKNTYSIPPPCRTSRPFGKSLKLGRPFGKIPSTASIDGRMCLLFNSPRFLRPRVGCSSRAAHTTPSVKFNKTWPVHSMRCALQGRSRRNGWARQRKRGWSITLLL